ncbi:MAG: DUF1456 family protein [Luteibacter sp.]|uniref:DUF1456 family protein n=1 Tax=unclassified Luteibacter TaxID=2620188 RepID=UPI0005BA1AF5|nr:MULTISPECIES: DUF1456 family protein [unclassified Luteibacter]MDQ7996380.1 DUF1456 family protein [Luteibacter sp.]MDR6642732.1 uncharacterized protein YehS (DUF1456 family) [Luteibacter sp. 1214]SKB69119.1 Uncharacterized conserved protein YehS, DUF1456 family [Luteibacter sp. 22Crub2.1]
MLNNDTLRSIRYMLDLGEVHVVEILKLTGFDATREQVAPWLRKEDEPDFVEMPDIALAHFLDGLIIHRRGRDESQPPRPVEARINNNLVLKKLRVAFELKEDDILALMANVGFRVSRGEINALFRQPKHSNFRLCGDQFLRNFLKGLTAQVRGA